LTGSTLTGTSLQIDIENGASTTVDLSFLQDGIGTDDQNISGSGLSGTTLTTWYRTMDLAKTVVVLSIINWEQEQMTKT